eukprot:gene19905-26608_t
MKPAAANFQPRPVNRRISQSLLWPALFLTALWLSLVYKEVVQGVLVQYQGILGGSAQQKNNSADLLLKVIANSKRHQVWQLGKLAGRLEARTINGRDATSEAVAILACTWCQPGRRHEMCAQLHHVVTEESIMRLGDALYQTSM